MTMMVALLTLGLSGQVTAAPASSMAPVVPPPENQIAAAVLAAPEDRRTGATVLGDHAAGAVVTLRAGVNDIVCLADDPKEAEFSVACYHKDLQLFHGARPRAGCQGRQGKATGRDAVERDRSRARSRCRASLEIFHVLTGSGFDPVTGTIADSYTRRVIYTPFATPEEDGFSDLAGAGWALADVSRNSHGAHHDQPATTVQVAPMTILLARLALLGVTLVEPPSHHVQGIDVEGGILWVTSVDRATRAGFLARHDLASGRRLASVEVHDGERFHPGGIQLDGDFVWVPVAEYRRASSAWIQKRDKATLALVAQFEVADHIGCVAACRRRGVGRQLGQHPSVPLAF